MARGMRGHPVSWSAVSGTGSRRASWRISPQGMERSDCIRSWVEPAGIFRVVALGECLQYRRKNRHALVSCMQMFGRAYMLEVTVGPTKDRRLRRQRRQVEDDHGTTPPLEYLSDWLKKHFRLCDGRRFAHALNRVGHAAVAMDILIADIGTGWGFNPAALNDMCR